MPNDTDDPTQEYVADMQVLQHEMQTLLDLWIHHADQQGQPGYGRAVALGFQVNLLKQTMEEAVAINPAIRGRCQSLIETLARAIAPPARAH